MEHIAARLREERERLGLSQSAFGALAGASKSSQVRYENGSRSPDGAYLSALAEHGVDVLFVLTGRRTPNHELLQQIRRKYGAVLDMAEVGENIVHLEEEEAAAGRAKERNDPDRLTAAIAAVEEGLTGTGRKLGPRQKAELILAAYDLLEEDTASYRDRIVRLVRAS